ncbi:hypothetical protein R6Q57_019654 [Mikania cordata]
MPKPRPRTLLTVDPPGMYNLVPPVQPTPINEVIPLDPIMSKCRTHSISLKPNNPLPPPIKHLIIYYSQTTFLRNTVWIMEPRQVKRLLLMTWLPPVTHS